MEYNDEWPFLGELRVAVRGLPAGPERTRAEDLLRSLETLDDSGSHTNPNVATLQIILLVEKAKRGHVWQDLLASETRRYFDGVLFSVLSRFPKGTSRNEAERLRGSLAPGLTYADAMRAADKIVELWRRRI